MAQPFRNIDTVQVVVTDCARLVLNLSCGHTDVPEGLELMLDDNLLHLLPVLMTGMQKICNQCPPLPA